MDPCFDVLDSIEPIALDWDELASRAGAPPFLRPGWFQAWGDAFGRGRLNPLDGDGAPPVARHAHAGVVWLSDHRAPRLGTIE